MVRKRPGRCQPSISRSTCWPCSMRHGGKPRPRMPRIELNCTATCAMKDVFRARGHQHFARRICVHSPVDLEVAANRDHVVRPPCRRRRREMARWRLLRDRLQPGLSGERVDAFLQDQQREETQRARSPNYARSSSIRLFAGIARVSSRQAALCGGGREILNPPQAPGRVAPFEIGVECEVARPVSTPPAATDHKGSAAPPDRNERRPRAGRARTARG